MRCTSPGHADLVAEYERIQAGTAAAWPGRPDAPWFIRTFLAPGDSSD